MSFITSALGSAFTPGGFNAAQGDSDNKNYVQALVTGLLKQLEPYLKSQTDFYAKLQPFANRSIMDLINSATPGGQADIVSAARRGFTSAATAGLPALMQLLKRGGAGIGALQGAGVGALNSATSAGNNLASWFASPEGRRSAAMNTSAAMGQANPAGQIGPYASLIYGREHPQVQNNGLGSALGQVAEIGSGAGWF
jgi:hypothetical protein